jgi:integrase
VNDEWRPWVALMIVGHHGMRFRAIRHIQWPNIDYATGLVTWPGLFQKQGKDVVQPITWALHAALITAKYWAERELVRRDKRETGVDRPTTRVRGAGGVFERDPNVPIERIETPWILFARTKKTEPYSYSSFQYQLAQGEIRAGIAHEKWRAAHGFRRMVVGNLLEATGDPMIAMNYVGDTDVAKQLKSYDKRMEKRISAGSASIEEGR